MSTWGAGTSKWGTIAGFALNNTSSPLTRKRGTAHSKTNNAIASNLYDGRTEISETFRAVNRAAVPTVPSLIGMLNSLPMTNLQVTTVNNNFATLVVAGHEHADGTDNGVVRTVAHGIALSAAFGISMFGFTAVDEVTESSATIECEHAEVPDADGDTAAGENHNPKVTLSITAHDGYATPPDGYEVTEQRPGTDAEGYNTFTTVAVKDLAFSET